MTTADATQKPIRKPSSHRAMQLRLERYAAMGPNCPNGHPWATNAKFTKGSYRFCAAYTWEKAENRRNDPTTYTGSCPHGHAYTRENTMINGMNQKVCITCKGKPDARPHSLKPGEMDEILRRARRGDTVNEISGEGPNHRGNGVISRMRLLAASLGDTAEAIELKGLLKQNGEAAVGNGRPLFRWSYEPMALLRTENGKGTALEKIADRINAQFDRDFLSEQFTPKRTNLGSPCDAIASSPPNPSNLPPLTAALRFPIGSLLDRINAVVPRHLSRDHRDDVIGEMALAIYEGRLDETDIQRRVREFVNIGYRREHDPWGDVSLDIPIPGTDLLRINTVSEGLWG